MRILITGATGLLGMYLINTASEDDRVLATHLPSFPKALLPKSGNCTYAPLEITDKDAVEDVFDRFRPEAVIHTASLANVDYCERNQNEAWMVNVGGTRYILNNCLKHGTKMVFLSSNAVFDGMNSPYSEDSQPHPIVFYGKTKLQSEEDIRESSCRHLILRLITMYGWNHPYERQNPATFFLKKLLHNEMVDAVTDVFNNHLYAGFAAKAIRLAVKNGKSGTFHIAGKDSVSRYGLVLKMAEVFGLNKNLINPVKSNHFPNLVSRPNNTTYSTEKMEKELGIKAITIKEGLESMKNASPENRKHEWLKIGERLI